MVERTVAVGVATYRRVDGPQDSILWGFGMHGEVVDVHPDDIDRFDRLNGNAPAEPQPLPDHMEDGGEEEDEAPAGAEPPRSGKGSGLEVWITYAESLDVAVPEDASRDDVIDLVDRLNGND